MLRNPLRPGGPRKTNPATVRISTEAAGRMPASMSVSGILNGSRRTRRRYPTLKADPVTSARNRERVQTQGSRAGMPGSIWYITQ